MKPTQVKTTPAERQRLSIGGGLIVALFSLFCTAAVGGLLAWAALSAAAYMSGMHDGGVGFIVAYFMVGASLLLSIGAALPASLLLCSVQNQTMGNQPIYLPVGMILGAAGGAVTQALIRYYNEAADLLIGAAYGACVCGCFWWLKRTSFAKEDVTNHG